MVVFEGPVVLELAPAGDHVDVVVAVYREAESVPSLVEALSRLDYPKERLDIKIVVEGDDMETRLALDLMNLAEPFEIVIAPSAGPRADENPREPNRPRT